MIELKHSGALTYKEIVQVSVLHVLIHKDLQITRGNLSYEDTVWKLGQVTRIGDDHRNDRILSKGRKRREK